jgi:nitroimidazol reductase NimA-like FMN-containing flavoprotein (pyridoxamine 5'-phosphate oxidase superfamily)
MSKPAPYGPDAPSDRTRLRRGAKRAVYDRAAVHAILDDALFCTVATVDAAGGPRCQPFSHWRQGDTVFLHGSSRNGLFAMVKAGAEICLSATLLDGLVWARSAMHHSVNYRSVVAYGHCRTIEDEAAKGAALKAMLDKYAPGRWPDLRPPSAKELKATEILALPLAEVSAKVRSGPPADDAADLALAVWAGVVPVAMVRGTPVADQPPPAAAAANR